VSDTTIIICVAIMYCAMMISAVAFAESSTETKPTPNNTLITAEPTGEIVWPGIDEYIKKEVARQLKELQEAKP